MTSSSAALRRDRIAELEALPQPMGAVVAAHLESLRTYGAPDSLLRSPFSEPPVPLSASRRLTGGFVRRRRGQPPTAGPRMEHVLWRDWADLVGREHGPLTFRLVVQPLVAAFFAVRSGLRDARAGRPAFFWAATTDPAQRPRLLREGWADIGRLFVMAALIDVAYSLIVLRWVYPGETLAVAVVLAVVPYAAVRGLTNRVARLIWRR